MVVRFVLCLGVYKNFCAVGALCVFIVLVKLR